MAAPFPLNPTPAGYASITPSARCGIYYVGANPAFTLSTAAPTTYVVRDYYGTVQSTGAVTGTALVPTPPTGGWRPGWYRLYLSAVADDAVFGQGRGTYNFCVIRVDGRFPTNPALGTSGGTDGGGVPIDEVTRGVLGLGPERYSVTDVTNPSVAITELSASSAIGNSYQLAYGPPERHRALLVSFSNGGVDFATLPSALGGDYLTIYVADSSVDGSQVFVSVGSGTLANTDKVTVFSPDSSTVVETYDNLTQAATASAAINVVSPRIRAFVRVNARATAHGPVAIGNAKQNALASVVTALYSPTGITRFEGPINEPTLNAETAHKMKLFHGAVKAGHPDAVVVGPNPVDINPSGATNLNAFLAAGGGTWCDEFSYHFYNGCNGDLNLGRAVLDYFTASLAAAGFSKPLWQTEQGTFTVVYGVYHPRRARWQMLQVALQEQYGVPLERNSMWYPQSHGFWAIPTFWKTSDGSLQPQCVLLRVYSEEVYAKPFAERLHFGPLGDRIFLGSRYTGTDGTSTILLMAGSAMPGASITLTIIGATSPLTVVDPFGNATTVSIDGGRAVIPVSELPTYVRLPAGATAVPYRVNDWPAIAANAENGTVYPVAATGSGTAASAACDLAWPSSYPAAAGLISSGAAGMPDDLTLTWRDSIRADRAVIWCGQVWQIHSAFVDFDVQTSADGLTWTTQATIAKSDCTSFKHGSSPAAGGCQRETFWDEQYIFDVPFSSGPVLITGLRLNVRQTSYGGEPDAACVVTGGQGDDVQKIVVQEVAVMCDSNASTRYVIG